MKKAFVFALLLSMLLCGCSSAAQVSQQAQQHTFFAMDTVMDFQIYQIIVA